MSCSGALSASRRAVIQPFRSGSSSVCWASMCSSTQCSLVTQRASPVRVGAALHLYHGGGSRSALSHPCPAATGRSSCMGSKVYASLRCKRNALTAHVDRYCGTFSHGRGATPARLSTGTAPLARAGESDTSTDNMSARRHVVSVGHQCRGQCLGERLVLQEVVGLWSAGIAFALAERRVSNTPHWQDGWEYRGGGRPRKNALPLPVRRNTP
jgi:hypothetical protein